MLYIIKIYLCDHQLDNILKLRLRIILISNFNEIIINVKKH